MSDPDDHLDEVTGGPWGEPAPDHYTPERKRVWDYLSGGEVWKAAAQALEIMSRMPVTFTPEQIARFKALTKDTKPTDDAV